MAAGLFGVLRKNAETTYARIAAASVQRMATLTANRCAADNSKGSAYQQAGHCRALSSPLECRAIVDVEGPPNVGQERLSARNPSGTPSPRQR